MRDDTKERIDKLEAFMDEQKLKQAQQAAISEYKKRVRKILWVTLR